MVPPGTYEVTVTDANMCVDSVTIVIDPADVVTVSLNTTDVITCPGGTVDIEATPQGGFGPYTYEWAPDPTGNTTDMLQGVGAGTYRVTVIDDDLCENIDSITILEPAPPTFNIQPPIAPGCQGDSSGVTNITVLPNSDFGGNFVFEASSG